MSVVSNSQASEALRKFLLEPNYRKEIIIKRLKAFKDPLKDKFLTMIYPDSYLHRLARVFENTSFNDPEITNNNNSQRYDEVFTKIVSLPPKLRLPKIFYDFDKTKDCLKSLLSEFEGTPKIQEMCESIVTHLCYLAQCNKEEEGKLYLRKIKDSDKIRPLVFLLTGPPGVGKTFCARLISQITNIPLISIDATGNDHLHIMGSSSHWSNSTCGIIANQLISIQNFPCIMLIDEVDKSGKTNDHNFIDVVNRITDPENIMEDKFLEVSLYQLKTFIIILTANYSDVIPPYVKSRAFEINVKIDRDSLAQKICKRLLNEFGLNLDERSSNKIIDCIKIGMEYLNWDFRKALLYLSMKFKFYNLFGPKDKRSFTDYLKSEILKEVEYQKNNHTENKRRVGFV